MKVVIKEKEHDYLPDYPKGWLFASGDPFKFPVAIGRYTCFIKRFEKKSPEDISGWNLLKQLKDKFDPDLPRIYDVVETEENRKPIHYIFYEYLAGETLEAAVSRNADLDLRRLTHDLFKGLEALHQKRFWFMDFCEKNIFCEAGGRFLLIDLDSVQPFSQMPHNHMDGDKQYWALVFNFYKEQLGYKDLRPSDISGPLLNYLQMIFLVLRLKISLIDKNCDYKSAELYDNLPALLQETELGFKEIFARAFTESRQGQRLLTAPEVRDFVLRHIIDNDHVPYRPTITEPIIRSFTASAGQVVPGQAFSLFWEVAHATRLALYRNGGLFKELHSTADNQEINEGYDGKPKKVVYTLVAANSATQITSEPLTVNIAELIIPEPEPEPEPEIVSTEQTNNQADNTTIPLDEITTPFDATDNPLDTNTTQTNQTTTPEEVIIPVIKPDPTKLRTIRLALLVLFLAIAGVLAVLAKSLLSRKKMEIAALKTSVTEGDTFIIPGKNFPDEANKVEVFFNGIKSNIIGHSTDTLRVLVPELPTNEDSTLAKVGLVVDKDTIYAANKVSVRKSLLLTESGTGKSSVNPDAMASINQNPDSVNQNATTSAGTADNTGKDEAKPDNSSTNTGSSRKQTTGKPAKTGSTGSNNQNSDFVEPPTPKDPPANIHEFVNVKSNVIPNQRRKGTKNLQITVQNTSEYDLDKVDVEIDYMRKNGRSLHKEILSFTKVLARSSQTLEAPDDERSKQVNFKIVAINSKPIY